MRPLFQDFRLAFRTLLHKPMFAFTVMVTLGLGIAANTVIFSVVNTVLLRPLPFGEPEQIVRVTESHVGFQTFNVTYATFLDLGAGSGTLRHLAASRGGNFTIIHNQQPEQLTGFGVSAEFFNALGVSPLLGRTFSAADDAPGAAQVVVLSHDTWQRLFAGDRTVAGKTLLVNDQPATILGVMPRGFEYPNASQMWTPLRAAGALRENRRSHLLHVLARLKPDATLEAARQELAMLARQIDQASGGVDANFVLTATSLHRQMTATVRPALLVLAGAVGLVLLIACANAANLLLARATERSRDVAIRSALGGNRWQVLRPMLAESMLLAMLGGAAGFLLAWWGTAALAAWDPGNIPRWGELRVDRAVMTFALALSLLTGLLACIWPALQVTGIGWNEALKGAGRSSSGVRQNRMRGALVVGQFALTLMLLAGAGLLLNSFYRLLQVNPGFNPQNLMTFQLSLFSARYDGGGDGVRDEQRVAFLERVIARIRALSGVVSAGLVNTSPLTGGASTTFERYGRPARNTDEELSADIWITDEHYGEAMQIPLLRGRWFTARDTWDAPRVMVINETLARRHFPGEDPIGQRITMKDWGPPMTGEVVGVIADVYFNTLDTEMDAMICWPFRQFPSAFNSVMVRTAGDPLQLATAVRQAVWAEDPAQAVARLRTMQQVMAGSMAQRRFYATALGVFAALALTLAAVGIYGAMAYRVTQRTREIGIRMALGAQTASVLGMVLGQGMKMVLAGAAVGLAGALALTRTMRRMLFGVEPTDAATLAAVATVLITVALLACWIPAMRAARVDPLVALREE